MTEKTKLILEDGKPAVTDPGGGGSEVAEARVSKTIDGYRENIFTRWAVMLGISSQKDVDAALVKLAAKERAAEETSLRQFFQGIGIRKEQMGLLLSIKAYLKQLDKDKKFGNIAVRNGFVTQDLVEKALAIQREEFREKRTSKKLGDMLVDNGHMTEDQRDLVLIVQSRKDPSVRSVAQTIRKNEKEMEIKLDRMMDVMISGDKLIAYVRVGGDITTGITVNNIRNWLFGKGIRYGIYNSLIEEVLKENTVGERFQVAEGQYPVPGQDASVTYYFDIGSTAEDRPGGDGGTALSDEGKIPYVKKGDLLAVIKPPEEGKPGINVFGKYLSPKPVREEQIWSGKGVFSADRLTFYAETDGLPKLSGKNTITVEQEFLVEGDVDGRKGEIIFKDDVNITGAVKNGARIQCHNLTANEILDATIEATGNVNVKNGIKGAVIKAIGDVNSETGIVDTQIRDHGNITAKYLKGVRLHAFGDVTVAREIVDCELVISGECTVRSGGLTRRGKIIASKITAKGGISAVDIGHPGTDPAELSVGMDVNMADRVAALEEKLNAAVALKENRQEERGAFSVEISGIEEKIRHMERVRESVSSEVVSCRKRISGYQERGEIEMVAHLEEIMGEMAAKSKASLEALDTYYLRQNETRSKVSGLQEQIAQVDERIARIQGRIDECAVQGGRRAVVDAAGTICESTVISGIHGGITLAKRLYNVRIEEVEMDDAQWKMVATLRE